MQFEKTSTKFFPHSLLFSRSRLLFNKECNDVSQDITYYGKRLAHSCETNSFMTFNKP